MKKMLLSSLLLFFTISQAQIITFSDANFKARLLSANSTNQIAANLSSTFTIIDTNHNGEIEVSEAEAISYLDISSFNYPANEKIAVIDEISNFVNLTNLNCSGNQITSLNVTGIPNLYQLYCSNNQLPSLIVQGLTQLITLDCSVNQLPSIDVQGLTNLQELSCSYNQIPSLNLQGLTSLSRLDCSLNQLPSLNIQGLNNLQQLLCSGNLLTSLNLQGLTNLNDIDCSNNQLPSLDVQGLINLTALDFHSNQIASIDLQGLTNLIYLNCSFNQLPTLDIQIGFTNLQTLECSVNQLTSLNVQGLQQLHYLGCGGNQLQSLNVQGLTNLTELYCSSNQLSDLNLEGLSSMHFLNCENNQLETLNIKCGNTNWNYNSDINSLYFSGNPNLQYICADDDGDIAMVQQKITDYGYTNCHVNSYCSFTPGGTYYTINGTNHYDENNNGCDTLDSAFPNLKLNIDNGTTPGGLITDTTGSYFYDVQAGTYTMTPQLEDPTYFNVSPTTAVSVTFPTQASPFTQDYCISANGTHHDLEIVLIPIDDARPGFDAPYKIKYKNKGTATEIATLSFNFDDAVMDFVTANLLPTTQNTGSLVWNLGAISPFQSGEITFTMNLNSPTETPSLNNGDVLNYFTVINGLFNDETPIDNSFTMPQMVFNSYDPNDKTCLEGSTVNPTMIGQYVHYKIRFENTGTYAAQNIVVMDMIDNTKLDISSLQMVTSSHQCYTRIAGNKVEFIFENINLPFDNAYNDGYVVFKIKTLPTLTTDSSFSNTANIYFDYNAAIVTNTTTTNITTLSTTDITFDSQWNISPNPTKDRLHISNTNDIQITSASIYNILGQLVLVITEPTIINVSDLKTGTYIIKVITDKGTSSMKFIKE